MVLQKRLPLGRGKYLIVFLMYGYPTNILATFYSFAILKRSSTLSPDRVSANLYAPPFPKQNVDASTIIRPQISSNKTCHGHDMAAEKTDKLFRTSVLFDTVSKGCNCRIDLKPRYG